MNGWQNIYIGVRYIAEMSQRTTKLHALLTGLNRWDDSTWFHVERYLLDNTSRLHMFMLVDFAGCAATPEARYFKTDAVKLLHGIPPRDVLRAWDELGALR
jgi:hypothetical protein